MAPSIELADLLDRCRNDLVFIDAFLGELEAIEDNSVMELSENMERMKSAEAARKSRPLQLNLDSVRRLVADIEDLCLSAKTPAAQEMLTRMQARMVRCLHLIPAHKHRLPMEKLSNACF